MPVIPDAWHIDVSKRGEIERYLVANGLLAPDSAPIALSPAGAGNMNLTLRVTPARGHSFIVKQGRPWVEKYPAIAAPAERTLVEAAFYAEVQDAPEVARVMPRLLHVDAANHVLVLDDAGQEGDFTDMYAHGEIRPEALAALLDWLAFLATVRVPADRRGVFANRAMRALNHAHLFDIPLRPDNGLDLDRITPGLRVAAVELIGDAAYREAVAAAGQRYLADGECLVHGDYFPGSWLHAADGIRIIDPEFCCLGAPELDYGMLVAHLTIANVAGPVLERVASEIRTRCLDAALAARYAGVEIMRRLIGVAQLPISLSLARKRALLATSRTLVLHPRQGVAS